MNVTFFFSDMLLIRPTTGVLWWVVFFVGGGIGKEGQILKGRRLCQTGPM